MNVFSVCLLVLSWLFSCPTISLSKLITTCNFNAQIIPSLDYSRGVFIHFVMKKKRRTVKNDWIRVSGNLQIFEVRDNCVDKYILRNILFDSDSQFCWNRFKKSCFLSEMEFVPCDASSGFSKTTILFGLEKKNINIKILPASLYHHFGAAWSWSSWKSFNWNVFN